MYFMFLSGEGLTLERLDFTVHNGSTQTFYISFYKSVLYHIYELWLNIDFLCYFFMNC